MFQLTDSPFKARRNQRKSEKIRRASCSGLSGSRLVPTVPSVSTLAERFQATGPTALQKPPQHQHEPAQPCLLLGVDALDLCWDLLGARCAKAATSSEGSSGSEFKACPREPVINAKCLFDVGAQLLDQGLLLQQRKLNMKCLNPTLYTLKTLNGRTPRHSGRANSRTGNAEPSHTLCASSKAQPLPRLRMIKELYAYIHISYK